MRVELVDVEDINPAAYNPRVRLEPGMAEYEALVRSIQEFGFVEPVVVNRRTNNLVGGHQRVEVAKRLGIRKVPVVYVDVDEIHEKALNLALDILAWARWMQQKNCGGWQ